ncbi:MAG: ParA family protein [Actinomycetota bacterium]
MKKTVFFNAKGGTGKTTICYNYGWYLSEIKKKKVLLMDFDPQINLVQSFKKGVVNKYGNNLESLVKNFIEGKEINFSSYVVNITPNLDLLPSSNNIALLEEYLTNHILKRTFEEKLLYRAKYRNQIIRKILEEKIKEDIYDYVLVDSQPNFSLLSTSSIIFAKNILVVIKPELFSFLDINYLRKIIRELQKSFYVNIKIIGVIINAYEKRRKDIEYLVRELHKKYGDQVRIYKNKIRYLSNYKKSVAMHRAPVFKTYPNSNASREMLELFSEITDREDEFYYK